MPPAAARSYSVRGCRFDVNAHYVVRSALGSGTYGVCAAATDTRDGSSVAIKKVSNAFEDAVDCRRILREICLLRHFNGHENILGIRDIMILGRPPRDMYVVTECMDTDLHQVIRSSQFLSDDHVQWFAYQMLRGIKALHSAGVLHRDLKPANLLVNKNCDLKICDFGLARGVDAGHGEAAPELTEYVVTRWYRAPELLVCAESYDGAIDVFSAGCILAEMLGRRPLLPGRDHLHQLRLVLRLLGTPSERELQRLEAIGDPEAWVYVRSLPPSPARSLPALFPHANPSAVRLLQKLITLDPAGRPAAAAALNDDYFADLHAINDEPSSPPFRFPRAVETKEVPVDSLRALLSEEHARYHPDRPALWAEDSSRGSGVGSRLARRMANAAA